MTPYTVTATNLVTVKRIRSVQRKGLTVKNTGGKLWLSAIVINRQKEKATRKRWWPLTSLNHGQSLPSGCTSFPLDYVLLYIVFEFKGNLKVLHAPYRLPYRHQMKVTRFQAIYGMV